METWKPVTKEPFSKYYEVSSLGRIRRGDRVLTDFNCMGYSTVPMQCERQIWRTGVHIVVALAFIGPPPGQMADGKWTVNHKNFNKRDNKPENLEWMTMSENLAHARANGRHPKGEEHPRSTLKTSQVLLIRELRSSGMKVKDIAAKLGVKWHAVSDVLNKRTWNHLP